MTWNRDDLAAGIAFLGIGLFFAVHAATRLEIGDVDTMGPGFFPLVLCAILIVLGAAILARARRGPSDERPPLNPRAVVMIVAAPIVFGLTLRSLGLVPSLAMTIALAVGASRTIGLAKGAAIVFGVTAFCVAVFYYGLQVPVELFKLDIAG